MIKRIGWERKTITCQNCGAILEYANMDVVKEKYEAVKIFQGEKLGNEIRVKQYIYCPECKEEVVIQW